MEPPIPSSREWIAAYVAAWTTSLLAYVARARHVATEAAPVVRDGPQSMARPEPEPVWKALRDLESEWRPLGTNAMLLIESAETAADADYFPLHESQVTIGRGKGCDLQLHDPNISRLQCVLYHRNGRWEVVDCESTNGTRVNGQRCAKAVLNDFDVLTVGDSTLYFIESSVELQMRFG